MLHYLRWPDFLVICLNLGAMIAIGIYTSRKSKSSEAAGCLVGWWGSP